MAKRGAAESKAAPSKNESTESAFVELMLAAAGFVESCGGLEKAKKSLEDAGRFIGQAGSSEKAAHALTVLESLKTKI